MVNVDVCILSYLKEEPVWAVDKWLQVIGESLSESHIYMMSVNFVCSSSYLYLCLSVRMFITR